MWLQNECDAGKRCGDLMWQGVGSSLGGFLDRGPALRAEGRALSSHAALLSCALLLAPSAAGWPWPRPCRESCVGRQKGEDDSSGLWVPGGRAVKQNDPGSPLCEVVWTLRKAAGAVPVILPPAAWEQRAATLGEPSSFSLLLKADYLQIPWLTHCPSSASATVSSKVCEYGFLCHLLKGNLPAASPWLLWDQFLGVQGGALWAKPSGPRLGTITGPPSTERWYLWTHWLSTGTTGEKRCICSGATTVFGLLSYFLLHEEGKVIKIPVDFTSSTNGPSKNTRFSLPHFR